MQRAPVANVATGALFLLQLQHGQVCTDYIGHADATMRTALAFPGKLLIDY
jgi:hypothetical protein